MRSLENLFIDLGIGPMPKTWRLEGRFNAFVIEQRSAQRVSISEQDVQNKRFNLLKLMCEIDYWITSPFFRKNIFEIINSVSAVSLQQFRRMSQVEQGRVLKSSFERSFLRGGLVAKPLPRPKPVYSEIEPSSSQEVLQPLSGRIVRPKPSPQKSWVKFVLEDEEGKGVKGESYRIEFSDGSFREGILDANGRVELNDITPGTCKVTFPDLDANDWELG